MLEQYLAREGRPYQFGAATTGVKVLSTDANKYMTGGALAAPIGRMVYADHAVVSLSAPGLITFAIAGDANGRFSGFQVKAVMPAGITTIPIRQFIRASEYGTAMSVFGNSTLTGADVTYAVAASLYGRLVTDDLNFGAAYPILVAGDSISAGTGPSKTAAMYHFMVRDWLIAQGYDCRVILRAEAGTTSVEHETWRAAGWHRPVGRAGMGLYCLGTNDANQSVDVNTSIANLTAYWTWFHSLYPAAPLIVVSPPPLANAAAEGRAASLRTAMSNYVASVASGLLQYVDTGSLWAGSDASKAPDGVHPNDAGHALIAQTITTKLQTTGVRPA